MSGLAAVCDCGTPWTFLLTFLKILTVQDVKKVRRLLTIAYNFRSNIHLMFKFCKLKEVYDNNIFTQVKTYTVIRGPFQK